MKGTSRSVSFLHSQRPGGTCKKHATLIETFRFSPKLFEICGAVLYLHLSEIIFRRWTDGGSRNRKLLHERRIVGQQQCRVELRIERQTLIIVAA